MGGHHATIEEIGQIRAMASRGVRNAHIAKKLNRSAGFISRIVATSPDSATSSTSGLTNGTAQSTSTLTAIREIINHTTMTDSEKVRIVKLLA